MENMDNENALNDQFLDQVNRSQGPKSTAEVSKNSNEEDALARVRKQRLERSQELQAEMNLHKMQEEKKPQSTNDLSPEEFEKQLIENQVTPEDIQPEQYVEKVTEKVEETIEDKKEDLNKLAEDAKVPEKPKSKPQSKRVVTNYGTDNPVTDETMMDPNSVPLPESAMDNSDEEEVTVPVDKIIQKKKTLAKPVEVITAEQAEAINTPKTNESIGKEVPVDDFEKTIDETREEFVRENARRIYGEEDDEEPEDYSKVLSDSYEDDSDPKENKPTVEVSNEIEKEEKPKKEKSDVEIESDNKTRNLWKGGDGEVSSFKNRSAKISKILRNVNVESTEDIRAVDLSSKSVKERNDFYLKNVLTTLQPNYSVIPLVVSGVVISMSALGWWDHKEICTIEEKLDIIDPNDEDYVYKKNMIFIEKREKQLDIFYKHIISVSGFEQVPEKERLFGEIIKFPDLPQLFFGAYCSTFPKPYTFNITCGMCGYTNEVQSTPKELCFLLNRNINLERLNHYINNGGSLNANETADAYKEFQQEELVQQCNKTFRIKKSLPNSAFIYELRIPTVLDVLDSLKEIADVFRDQAFEYVGDTDDDVIVSNIDSSFGLPPYLMNLRKYLYLHSVLVAQPVKEDKESNTIKVNYVTIKDKSSVIGSLYNLSSEDYNTLMNDIQLNNLVKCIGIQHGIKAKKCQSSVCGNDMGIIPVDPEQLFFTIARANLSN